MSSANNDLSALCYDVLKHIVGCASPTTRKMLAMTCKTFNYVYNDFKDDPKAFVHPQLFPDGPLPFDVAVTHPELRGMFEFSVHAEEGRTYDLESIRALEVSGPAACRFVNVDMRKLTLNNRPGLCDEMRYPASLTSLRTNFKTDVRNHPNLRSLSVSQWMDEITRPDDQRMTLESCPNLRDVDLYNVLEVLLIDIPSVTVRSNDTTDVILCNEVETYPLCGDISAVNCNSVRGVCGNLKVCFDTRRKWRFPLNIRCESLVFEFPSKICPGSLPVTTRDGISVNSLTLVVDSKTVDLVSTVGYDLVLTLLASDDTIRVLSGTYRSVSDMVAGVTLFPPTFQFWFQIGYLRIFRTT